MFHQRLGIREIDGLLWHIVDDFGNLRVVGICGLTLLGWEVAEVYYERAKLLYRIA